MIITTGPNGEFARHHLMVMLAPILLDQEIVNAHVTGKMHTFFIEPFLICSRKFQTFFSCDGEMTETENCTPLECTEGECVGDHCEPDSGNEGNIFRNIIQNYNSQYESLIMIHNT